MADGSRRSSRISLRSKQIGQLLLENGDIQNEQISEALRIQEDKGGLIGQILQTMGACTGQAVAAALLKQVQITDVKCDELSPRPEVSKLVTREICESARLCPFERMGNLLCVVMGNPLDRKAITQIEEKTKLKVKSFKAPWVKINDMIQRTYSEGGQAAADEEVALEEPQDLADISPLEAPPLELSMEEEPEAFAPPVLPPPSAPASTPRAPSISSPSKKAPAPPVQAKIKGIDNLDDSNAEMIETDKRGLAKRGNRPEVEDEAPKPRPEKKAKVNVDLENMDFTGADVVAEGGEEGEYAEALEEMDASEDAAPASAEDLFIRLKNVEDGYFYVGGKAPGGGRAPELNAIIGSLAVADVLAESIEEYEAKNRPKPLKLKELAATNGQPIELQPVPAGIMAPIKISESEFQRFVVTLGEDPVGEWDWHFVASGPVPVQAYEEN